LQQNNVFVQSQFNYRLQSGGAIYMNKITFAGNPINLLGEEIKVGSKAPNFTAVKQDLTPFHFMKETDGKIKIISVAPSIDTGIC
jgi:thiol peroxidase